jgi:hypothetical protein
VVYGSHLTIVPGDRDRIPTRLSDSAAISRIASPINTVTFREAFRFGDCHCCGSLACYAAACCERDRASSKAFQGVRKCVGIASKEADLAYFDENRDGRVSRDEFVNKPNPLFARYDKNHDCKVTPQELKDRSGIQQTPPAGKRGTRGDR